MSEKVFDPAILDDLRQLDPQIVKDVIALFFEQFPKELGLLREILKSNDTAAIAKKAHLLKSSARQVGGLRMGEVCYQVEKDPGSAETKSRVDQLVIEFESLRKELIAYGDSK